MSDPQNVALKLAAALTVLIAGAHSYLGERYVLMRLFRRGDLPKLFGGADFTKQTLRFAWHITSVAWVGLGALIAVMASGDVSTRILTGIIAATFGMSGLIALGASRGRHLSWIVFLSIAALVWFGHP